MDFSLMFFSGGEGRGAPGAYRAIRDIAEFADRSGFKRIWIPERHFVPFGALHPAPAVLAASLAATTKHVRLAAGSVVAPLHHPKRIVEDWSVVDNLSEGRVDVSLASGWLKSDFEFAPASYDDRHAILGRHYEEVKRIWRTSAHASVSQGSGVGERIYPTPVQPELPIWITAARNPQTFKLAGSLGANVLTYLVDLGVERLQQAIGLYREARAAAGYGSERGHVTVMLHTCIAAPNVSCREQIKHHYSHYLMNNQALLQQSGRRAGELITPDVVQELVDVQFERVYERLSLMGSKSAAIQVLETLSDIGVDEVACLVDFIEDAGTVIGCLPELDSVKGEFRRRAA